MAEFKPGDYWPLQCPDCMNHFNVLALAVYAKTLVAACPTCTNETVYKLEEKPVALIQRTERVGWSEDAIY